MRDKNEKESGGSARAAIPMTAYVFAIDDRCDSQLGFKNVNLSKAWASASYSQGTDYFIFIM
jgi:hypothetical protein